MILVFFLSAIVSAAAGALLGGLVAHLLPRAVLFLLWGAIGASVAFYAMQGRSADEFTRIEANVMLFAVLLPGLIGSLFAGVAVLRKRIRHGG